MAKKRMRLPNGFGQISEIKGRSLRKPFRAMVSVGKKENGRPIVKPLKPQSYFGTYNEAYEALMEYNRSSIGLTNRSITMNELYEQWSSEHFKKISKSTKRSIELAWRYCSSLHNIHVFEIRTRHIKECLENGTIEYRGEIRTVRPAVKRSIKSTLDCMFDYAVENEIVDKNYSRSIKSIKYVSEKGTEAHINFSEDELELLWKNIKIIKNLDMVIVQCYMGWRPQELCSLLRENVNINDWTIRGGMKTVNGINRLVPVHSAIRNIIKSRYDEGYEYLFCRNGKPLSYKMYHEAFKNIILSLGLNSDHKPHDCRKTFVSLAKKYEVNEFAIKRIVGHSINDLTERIYTNRPIEWYKQEIEKIKVPVGIVQE